MGQTAQSKRGVVLSTCPRGLCDGSGEIRIHSSAVAGDPPTWREPCLCAASLPVEQTENVRAWAEAVRLTDIACEKLTVAEQAGKDWRAADATARTAIDAAAKTGPRPTEIDS